MTNVSKFKVTIWANSLGAIEFFQEVTNPMAISESRRFGYSNDRGAPRYRYSCEVIAMDALEASRYRNLTVFTLHPGVVDITVADVTVPSPPVTT